MVVLKKLVLVALADKKRGVSLDLKVALGGLGYYYYRVYRGVCCMCEMCFIILR